MSEVDGFTSKTIQLYNYRKMENEFEENEDQQFIHGNYDSKIEFEGRPINDEQVELLRGQEINREERYAVSEFTKKLSETGLEPGPETKQILASIQDSLLKNPDRFLLFEHGSAMMGVENNGQLQASVVMSTELIDKYLVDLQDVFPGLDLGHLENVSIDDRNYAEQNKWLFANSKEVFQGLVIKYVTWHEMGHAIQQAAKVALTSHDKIYSSELHPLSQLAFAHEASQPFDTSLNEINNDTIESERFAEGIARALIKNELDQLADGAFLKHSQAKMTLEALQAKQALTDEEIASYTANQVGTKPIEYSSTNAYILDAHAIGYARPHNITSLQSILSHTP